MKSHTTFSERDRLKLQLQSLRRLEALHETQREKEKSFGLCFYKPHYYQHRFHIAGEVPRRMFEAGNRVGKCLIEGTMVATPQGAKPIESLKAGDEVFNRKGKITRVRTLYDQGEQIVWDYCNRNKVYVTATEEHRFETFQISRKHLRFDPKLNTTKVLRGKEFDVATLVKRIYPETLQKGKNEPTAYSLGAFLGDGCCTCKGANYLEISSKDEKVPNHVAKELGCIAEQRARDVEKNYRWIVRSSGFPLYDKWFRGKLCHEKEIDLEEIKTWDRNSVLRFVAGLIDTDGSLIKSKDGFILNFCNQSLSAIKAYEWCILSLWQQQVSISKDNRDRYKNGSVYSATLRNPHAIKQVCTELYPFLAHKYKADIGGIENLGKRSRAEAIKLTLKNPRKAHCYDIEVEDKDHLFLLANGIVSHNTQMGTAEDIAWLLGYRPWYERSWTVLNRDGTINCSHEGYKGHPYATVGIPKPPNKVLVLVNDSDIVPEVFTGKSGKIWEYMPPDFIVKRHKNTQGHYVGFECANGSVLYFDTLTAYKNNPQGQESKDWDAIHVDEPIPQDMWSANARGLSDRDGKAWFTLTPIREPWIGDLFYPDTNNPKDRPDQWTKEDSDGKPEYWVINCDMWKNPYNSEAGIKRFLDSLDPEEREAREFGIPLAFAGLIYKNFSYDRHVLKEPLRGWRSYFHPPKDEITYVTIDPHTTTDYHALLCSAAKDGTYCIYDEIKTHPSPDAFIPVLKAKLEGKKVGWIKCDPFAWNGRGIHTTLADDFIRAGVNVIKAPKDLQQGIAKCRQLLSETDKDGDPILKINPNLTGFLKGIRNYIYDKNGKVRDKDDHFMECFYRLFFDRPRWYNEKDAQNFRMKDELFTGLMTESERDEWNDFSFGSDDF
jgi:hypothetical protein